jgi:hypothetical protein
MKKQAPDFIEDGILAVCGEQRARGARDPNWRGGDGQGTYSVRFPRR